MKNLQIVYILFLLRHCLCQNYTQTKNLLEDDSLVLHYGVQDQQFKFKLVVLPCKPINLICAQVEDERA